MVLNSNHGDGNHVKCTMYIRIWMQMFHLKQISRNRLSCVVLTNFLHILYGKIHAFIHGCAESTVLCYSMIISEACSISNHRATLTKFTVIKTKRKFYKEITNLSFARTSFHFHHLPMFRVYVCNANEHFMAPMRYFHLVCCFFFLACR